MITKILAQTIQSGFAEDLAGLLAEGGTLGTVTYFILAGFFWAWKNWWNRGDIENNKKMLISAATPIVLVNIAYWLGVSINAWPATLDAWWQAMKVAGMESIGALGIRGATGLLERKIKKAEVEAREEEIATIRAHTTLPTVNLGIDDRVSTIPRRDARGRFISSSVPETAEPVDVTPEMVELAGKVMDAETYEEATQHRSALLNLVTNVDQYSEARRRARRLRGGKE